jgi:hypothetical protein
MDPSASNLTAQYRVRKYLCPELEVNSTLWPNGRHDGKKQVFLSPGQVAGNISGGAWAWQWTAEYKSRRPNFIPTNTTG